MHVGTTGRVADLLLVVGTLALTVGLGALMEGLMPALDGSDAATLEHRLQVVIQVGSSRPAPDAAPDDPTRRLPSARERTETAAARTVVGTSVSGPRASPLYPQNGVTLWDRIRVSSPRDRQAFLFGAAIQLHAPQVAATPGSE